MPLIAWLSAETPDREGGGGQRRQYHQIRALLDAGVSVHVVTLDSPQSDETVAALTPVTRLRRNRAERLLRRNGQWTRTLQTSGFTGAIVAHVESVPHFASGIQRIELSWLLDFQNVNSRWHALIGDREAEASWTVTERQAAITADLNTVCSAEERKALKSIAPQASVEVAGNGIDPSEWPDAAVGATRERVVVMFGAWSHRPNAEAASWIASHVWPSVRDAVPDAHLALAGPGVPPAHCLSVNGITHVGRVDDLASFLGKAMVVVVPIRRGIGSRVKFGEALASGAAVVSTSVGAEGFSADGVFVRADDEWSFADACIQLLTHPSEAIALGAVAREFALAQLSWSITTRPMVEWALDLP